MQVDTKSNHFGYLSQDEAIELDKRLFSLFEPKVLIELAGQSVAHAAYSLYSDKRNALIVCGKGNNGNDGIAAARHMKLLGFDPTVLITGTQATNSLNAFDVSISSDVNIDMSRFDLVVDALLGFGARGPPRSPYDQLISSMKKSETVISIDVPSGWDVGQGDIYATNFMPQAVVSLSAPKLCMKNYKNIHVIGGRFIPKKLAKEFNIDIPFEANALFTVLQ